MNTARAIKDKRIIKLRVLDLVRLYVTNTTISLGAMTPARVCVLTTTTIRDSPFLTTVRSVGTLTRFRNGVCARARVCVWGRGSPREHIEPRATFLRVAVGLAVGGLAEGVA